MTLGDVIRLAFEWVYDLWPLRIVNAWEAGIRITFGRSVTLVGPGLRWFFPIIGELIVEDVVPDVNTTDLQSVTTTDDVVVTFALAWRYRVANLRALYLNLQDHETSLAADIAASAARWAASMTYADLDGNEEDDSLPDLVFRDVNERWESWGVELLDVSLFTFTRARCLRLLMGD